MQSSPTAIPAFRDNYIWALPHGRHCVVVDPGDAAPVEAFLDDNQLSLSAILITHHHPDHVGGILRLLERGAVPVYGPADEIIPGRTRALVDGDTVEPEGLDLSFQVLAVPGHTLGHIAFYSPDAGWLFCGDTLFAGGCGRLFEGTAAQMHASLQRLAALPGDTRVFCAHEYTQANLAFAAAVSPDDQAVLARQRQVIALREADRITLPTTLAEERASNPFLRPDNPAIQTACRQREPQSGDNPVDTFATLRRWKDNF
ncbi:metallo-beta-lactamase family protein [Alcanivorax hongdengensis A-11-3]|uniref:Hydroxyacylglutathione hydrolase n=1 Tax=Alcanivorax hongdengensis A-11-3 TaxID=1177179 RepID=L0WGH6_9GAMM|nr:hydroxyacylglutathione hydrolase [Alcanivorax hongdengensis]EKF74900.1 metallo-beta-lactamase family protein [Alcanivorax hongdengensis A-11-3]